MGIIKGFSDRTAETQTLINVMHQILWSHPQIQARLIHVHYGYETHIPESVREKMRYLYNETARYIRFAPDFFVLDTADLSRLYLLEYKCTRTPLYSERRIAQLRGRAAKQGLEWPDIGQWEASAYDNYKALQKIGVRVAILNYCAYHSRPLLCDFVDKATELGRYEVLTDTTTGSRTPFVNLDMREFRTLVDFLIEEHRLESNLQTLVRQLCDNAARRLLELLPVTHHRNSPYSRER